MRGLSLGVVRVVGRPPASLWNGATDAVVITTGAVGFAGASEADRARLINAFRRLLDGLDARLQVLIEVEPGSGAAPAGDGPVPVDFDGMRSADIWFADQVARAPSAHRRSVSLVTTGQQVPRLESALREMGIIFYTSAAPDQPAYGSERSKHFLHSGGWSRSWYLQRLPGGDLETGWVLGLIPPGRKVSLSWHASPLPVAWIVEYLQRQLINMRTARMQELVAGTSDPSLAGALPNAEDLQRRLAASQEKAFHVSVYLTLTSATEDGLESGAQRLEAAARAVLSDVQPCTFRMFDSYLATRPAGIDRLDRKRVLDTSTLVTFFPWADADLQQPAGLVIGTNRATGAPVLVDPFDQRCYANANIGVFGHSGAGKTYLLSSIAMGALGRGIQVYVIDPEHES